MEKTAVDANGSFFYRDEGEGLAVMLVHGFAEDGSVWDAVAASLMTDCRLLIPDLPGSGRSSLLSGEASLEALAAACIRLLDQEKINRCIFIGHSMGGYITLAIAQQYPDRVLAIGLFHSTSYPDSEEKKAGRLKSIEFIRQHGAAPYIRQSTPNLFAVATRETYPEMIEEMIWRFSGFSAGSLIYYLEAMRQRPDRQAVLKEFAGPVLFIIGENDAIVPLEQSLKQCHIPPLCHIHILAAAGHMGMLEEPHAGANSIRSFLNFIKKS